MLHFCTAVSAVAGGADAAGAVTRAVGAATPEASGGDPPRADIANPVSATAATAAAMNDSWRREPVARSARAVVAAAATRAVVAAATSGFPLAVEDSDVWAASSAGRGSTRAAAQASHKSQAPAESAISRPHVAQDFTSSTPGAHVDGARPARRGQRACQARGAPARRGSWEFRRGPDEMVIGRLTKVS